MNTLPILFWISIAGLFYIYLGYPALIAMLARMAPRPVQRGPFKGAFSVVMAVHNEAAALAPKLRSLLAARGLEQLAEVLIGSDGSTDHPGDVVADLRDARIRLVEFPARRGKASVLNELVPMTTGSVVIMMDARQEIHPDALEALLRCFHDLSVGVVSGDLVFRSGQMATTSAKGIDAYWRYEKFIRRNESRFRSVPGATGALYAIRRSLFRPIPASTLLDDVAIPMRAVMEGCRCVFEDQALVFDDPSPTAALEQMRKRRTIAGNAQLMALFPSWLLPWKNPIWFEFVSHKLARLLSPALLIAVGVANVLLLEEAVYIFLFVLQCGFYFVAVLGGLAQRQGWRWGLLGLPYMFLALNGMTACALCDAARGSYRVTWERSHGTPPPAVGR